MHYSFSEGSNDDRSVVNKHFIWCRVVVLMPDGAPSLCQRLTVYISPAAADRTPTDRP